MSENKDNQPEAGTADAVQGPDQAKQQDDSTGGKPAAEAPAPKPGPSVASPSQPPPSPAPVKRGAAAFIAWLALFLVVVLAGAVAWSVQQALLREESLQQRVDDVESVAGGEQAQLQALERKLQAELNGAVQATQAQVQQQATELATLDERLQRQGEQLAAYSANDHESWLRAEAQYLLRLANQRVLMARDTESALALLQSADSILRQLDDSSLHEVRAAVAAEQAALRAVPQVDVEGIYLRLSALVEQAGQLRIFEMPEQEARPEREDDEDWQVRLQRGYEEAASKLSEYIVIRRRDVPMQALMDPQWEGLVRQNLRMLLEQAQVALLSGNQTLYVESLERAQHWVAQFFDTDEAAARAMAREISSLEGQTIQVVMPDLSRSLRALDEAVKKRLQQGGAE